MSSNIWRGHWCPPDPSRRLATNRSNNKMFMNLSLLSPLITCFITMILGVFCMDIFFPTFEGPSCALIFYITMISDVFCIEI